MRTRGLTPLLALALGVICFSLIAPAQRAAATDSSSVKKLFANPPTEYSTGPLWVWNDLLTERQIVETLRDLATQRVKQVFVHPRPGLMTPYLTDDWFKLWKVALNEAERLDMNVWIYDENSYPSGFAGGFVPEAMPESRGRGLVLREIKTPTWTTNHLAVFRLKPAPGSNSAQPPWENVTDKIRAGEKLPNGSYLEALVQRSANSPWHGGRSYVDLLYPGVTEKFLELTMEPYRRELGGQFGKRIPGVFTDEPNIRPAGGLPWTDDLPEQFQKRWGYDLREHLPSLKLEAGDWRRVRHNFFATLNELFVERWAKPYGAYCAKHGLEMTGHYWEHEWPHCSGVPDNMSMYAWQQRPAIDTLMNQYQENTHAQFGNARAVKELSSVANQLGLKRTLCEVYGAGGWDLRFEDMKRIGDWLSVLGVNTLDQHLSYVTIRGARKRDHPQSFSYHEPWWDAYHISAEYFARLSAALSQGEQINRVLVLEPTTTAWMYQGHETYLKELGDAFAKFVAELEAAQIEYDIGCEDILARHGSVANGELVVGQRRYRAVVLPPVQGSAANLNPPVGLNLNRRTWTLLKEFSLARGATVLDCTQGDKYTDGSAKGSPAVGAAADPRWQHVLAQDVPKLLQAAAAPDSFAIKRAPDDKGILFHQRRSLDDGELLFLVNTSIQCGSSGMIESRAQGVECWDPETGKNLPYAFETGAKGIRAGFELPPCGSLLLFLSKELRQPAPRPEEHTNTIVAAAAPQIRRVEPNVLVLDYVDVTAGGETRTNLYFYQASQFAFQKNGLERNPWDSAVQFRDELIKKRFPAGSGFEATYRFVIAGKVPASLSIVIERPDLYAITCNGRKVECRDGAWWLDKAFGKIDLAAAARVGENSVTIKASPFTMQHELESAYLLGDFSLSAGERGFTIVPDKELHLGRWNEQGHPFYSAGLVYREDFQVADVAGRYVVTVPKWYGSVAKVSVNGKAAGYIAHAPWQCDVTPWIKHGSNDVEIVTVGTLKNTLGPHHGNPGLGSAWPGMFQKGPNPGPPPGAQYHTVGYGLFGPFVLKQIVASH